MESTSDLKTLPFSGSVDHLYNMVVYFFRSFQWPDTLTFGPYIEKQDNVHRIYIKEKKTRKIEDKTLIEEAGIIGTIDMIEVTERRSTLISTSYTPECKLIMDSMHKVINELISTSKHSITERRKRRAGFFKLIKDSNSSLSYTAVATMAQHLEYERIIEELRESFPEWSKDKRENEASERFSEKWGKSKFTKYDVINDYRLMGWEWKRADKL